MPVHLVGCFDPAADGGASIGTMGWWIDSVDCDASAGSKLDTSVTVAGGDGKKNVYAVFKVFIVNFFQSALVSPVCRGVTTLDTRRPTTCAPRAASCRRFA